MFLNKLGYEVILLKNEESGRAAISKGFLKYARKVARKNLDLYQDKVSEKTPLIGVEPSAILTFRDEYPRFFKNPKLKPLAFKLKKNTFLLEEFLMKEIEEGNLKKRVISFEKKKYHRSWALSSKIAF